MERLAHLQVWYDTETRSAAENMAVDELVLSECLQIPLIRFYSWSRPSVSFGYFESYDATQQLFLQEGVDIVRRMTGGGVVDHRVDNTYSIFLPASHEWSQLRGAESYRRIHVALIQMLNEVSISAKLTLCDASLDSISCYDNPVRYDVVSHEGDKLAGAGQRRTRRGMLHQGSVQIVKSEKCWQSIFVNHLANYTEEIPMDHIDIQKKVSLTKKYSSAAWLQKR